MPRIGIGQVVLDHVTHIRPVDQVVVRVDDGKLGVQDGFVAARIHLAVASPLYRACLWLRLRKSQRGGCGQCGHQKVSSFHGRGPDADGIDSDADGRVSDSLSNRSFDGPSALGERFVVMT